MSKALVKGSLSALSQRDNLSLAESFLNVDAVLLVDMSGSMAAEDAPGGLARWDAAENELRRLQEQLPGKLAVIAFSSEVQFCPSGVPIRFGGGTDMAKALHFVRPADGLGIRFILISDGQPDDEKKTLKVARSFKSRIDTVYIGPEDGGVWSGRDFLAKLAAESGGIATQSKAPGLLAEQVTLLLTASA